ncbi:MAG: type II secretion system inner membrane protein GspF [Betaproteobacteria bacterium]|nr:type II secretion system inner membrane protein GspF [Betaproteobacteria bacterium]
MPTFRYQAVTPEGAHREGLLEAGNPRAARDQLRAQGLLPVEVAAAAAAPAGAKSAQRLSATDRALLTRQLATLLAAAMPLEEALGALAEQSEGKGQRAVLEGVRQHVLAGESLAQSLAQYPRVFSEFYRGLVAVAGETGQLAEVMARLADYLEARQALRQKILLAALYPCLVAVIALAVVAALLLFVVPQVVAAFEHTRQTLPWLTRALIGVSGFLRANVLVLLALIALAAVAGYYASRRERTRLAWHRLVLKLPAIGRLLLALDCARFASTLAILVGSGAPLLRSLEAAAGVIWLVPLREAARGGTARVREGVGLARALDAGRLFPPLFLQLVASGEASGRLPELLQRAAAQQQSEAERRLAILVGLLEPALILVMGGVVLLMVLAVMLPIVSMNQLIR